MVLHQSRCRAGIAPIQVQRWYCTNLAAQLILHQSSCVAGIAPIQLHRWYCTNLAAQLVLHQSSCIAGIARHRMPDPQSGSSCAQPQRFFWLYICHYFYISRQKCAPFGKYCTASLPDLSYNSIVLSIFYPEYFPAVSGDFGCLIYLAWQTCLVFTAACICQYLRGIQVLLTIWIFLHQMENPGQCGTSYTGLIALCFIRDESV